MFVAFVRAALVVAAIASVDSMRTADAVESERRADATALFFTGLDLWRGGNFTHGGAYWSPDGLDREGFTLKAMLFGGVYRYSSGGPGGTQVQGRQLGAQILPGWRFIRDRIEIKFFAGPEIAQHRLFPDDPAAGLRGQRAGIRTTAEAWYSHDAVTMIAGHASFSSVGASYEGRIYAGWKLFDLFYAGPEVGGSASDNYRQFRAGLHVTSLQTGEWEWSGAMGFARDSDRISGVYARVGVITRR
jgi:hypothetical protein